MLSCEPPASSSMAVVAPAPASLERTPCIHVYYIKPMLASPRGVAHGRGPRLALRFFNRGTKQVCVASYREVTGIIGIQLASLLRGKPRSREYLVATWTSSGTRVEVTVGRISVGRPFTRDAHRTGARERVNRRAGGDTTWTGTPPPRGGGGSMQDLHGSGKVYADARTPQNVRT